MSERSMKTAGKISTSKWKFTVIVLLIVARLSETFEVVNKRFEQVPNTFLEKFNESLLSVVATKSMRTSQSLGCKAYCSATPKCTLACYNGVNCLTSSALVTPYWKPVASSSQSLLPFSGYKCFSSWIFENDLTTKIFKTSVSTLNSWPGSWNKDYAIDGYYTDSIDTHFDSENEHSAWYQIDMGIAYAITEVIVKVRKSTTDPCNCSRFTNVEVRVGNSSATGDFTGNALLGFFNGSASQGQFVFYTQVAPIVGRYISLQQKHSDWFILAEVKVIGY